MSIFDRNISMDFASVSRQWRVRADELGPEALAELILEAVVKRLPDQALGHAKLSVDYEGGMVFASSSLIPPEITVRKRGDYAGGRMDVSLVLIFGNLEAERLSAVLLSAREDLESRPESRLVMEELA
ncbi:MAG: hypothetical protein AB1641_31380 [Thermodesulfobacteriota bacterium]